MLISFHPCRVEIGLVRIYLMELAGTDLHPTGRVVVLSNAVLFQPSALFKQVPGADYLWHIVKITLSAATDVVAAESRMEVAAESVYEGYRASIERQHAFPAIRQAIAGEPKLTLISSIGPIPQQAA